MKTIISPAMKMEIKNNDFSAKTTPQFLPEAEELRDFLRTQNREQLAAIWQSSPAITQVGIEQLQALNFTDNLTPAVFSFSGIQYQYLTPDIFDQAALAFMQEHVRILSGLYGVLRPFDGVNPYRLEMKNKLPGFGDGSLYHFWGSKLADNLFQDTDTVINLASKEYSKAIAPYLGSGRTMITVDFQELKQGKWKTVGVHAKMARGELTKFICEQALDQPEELHDFNDFGFVFDEKNSTETHYVFRTEFDFTRH